MGIDGAEISQRGAEKYGGELMYNALRVYQLL